MGKYKAALRTGSALTLFVFLVLTTATLWLISLVGYYHLYGLGGLLFGVFAPGVAQTFFPFLVWWTAHFWPWQYIILYFLSWGFWIGFAILASRIETKEPQIAGEESL